MSDIFISYASQDRSRAKKFVAIFEEQGWSVFWDRTIPAGKTWREVIGRELEESKSIVVLWTTESVKSGWVHEEADDGLRRKILVPIRIENVQPPIGFGGVQTADLSRWRGGKNSSALKVLLDDIRTIVEKPVAGAASARKRKPARKKTPARKTATRSAKKTRPIEAKPEARKAGEGRGHSMRVRLAAAALLLLLAAGGFYMWNKQREQQAALLSAQVAREQGEADARKRDDAAWEQAKQKNSVAGYDSYRSSHPKGTYLGQAVQNIANLQIAARLEKEKADAERKAREEDRKRDDAAWARTMQKFTVAGFTQYLALHIAGRHRDEATNIITALKAAKKLAQVEAETRRKADADTKKRDDTAWARAKRENTVAGYRAYMNEHADGEYREQAELIVAALEPVERRRREEDARRGAEEDVRRRDDEAWNLTREENTIGGYRTYQRAYPAGRHGGEAENLISSLSVKPDPTPPPLPAPVNLLDTITPASNWAVSSRKNCFKASKAYSLNFKSPFIFWRDGLGNVDIELVVSSGENEFTTRTRESRHVTKKNVTIGQTWTYRKIGTNRILVTPGGKRSFQIEKCS